MLKTSFRFFSDLLWMMYPSLCAACGRPLFTGEECICSPCLYHLPRTGFHNESDNFVAMHFWGKVKIEGATAFLYFSKGQQVQKIIHQLKYKGRQDVGKFMGELMGLDLLESDFAKADMIVPVPLHAKRLKERGYNQSNCFAEGLSATLGKDFFPDALNRTEATSTQTRKHRFERFQNVDRIFDVSDENIFRGKTVLLVDDVVTTGSTLISCAESVLLNRASGVYIAAIACA